MKLVKFSKRCGLNCYLLEIMIIVDFWLSKLVLVYSLAFSLRLFTCQPCLILDEVRREEHTCLCLHTQRKHLNCEKQISELRAVKVCCRQFFTIINLVLKLCPTGLL